MTVRLVEITFIIIGVSLGAGVVGDSLILEGEYALLSLDSLALLTTNWTSLIEE